jgi:outer membrane protein
MNLINKPINKITIFIALKKKPFMKKLILPVIIVLFTGFSALAQRYAVIDTKYILSKMPEYTVAEKKLQDLSTQWQKEIDDKQALLNQMYKDYDAEQFMLSDELKKKREDELFNKEKELRDLQKRRFGYEGDLFKERQNLVKPLQDKVYNAVQKIAVAHGYDFILDKSEGITVIFADPKLEKSDEVLRELGVKS